jgi:flagellar hook-associated protein 3 FlgL
MNMLSSLDPSAQKFLYELGQISDRMNRAQQEVSTGLKISKPSDAPDQISTLLQARANLDSLHQTLTNLGRFKGEVDSGEQALQNVVRLFDQVQTLGAQGNTDTETAAERADIAQQLDSILHEVVALAGTSVERRYIFSGDSDQQIPYTYDATQQPPVSAYLGSASTRLAQHPNGTTFTVALTAQQIFDASDPSTNVFTTIENLSTALKNNDAAAIRTADSGLAKVGEYLNTQLATYGAMQNTIADGIEFGQTRKVQLQALIGALQDADLSQAILEMNQAQIQQQAALESRAQLPRTTLFSFLG